MNLAHGLGHLCRLRCFRKVQPFIVLKGVIWSLGLIVGGLNGSHRISISTITLSKHLRRNINVKIEN
jgi:hypothetical protein